MSDKRIQPDRRKHPRFQGRGAPLKFRRLNTPPSGVPDPYHEGRVVDISKGGMCFYADQNLTCGEKIEYCIESLSGEKSREGVARVLHTHDESDLRFIGVQFIG